MVDLKRFNNNLSVELRKLFSFFIEEGFKPGVVGGIPRDYLNEASMGKDFDVELRPVDEEDFKNRFLQLPKKLKSQGHNPKEKGYDIWEIELGDISVEFGLPRIEVFNDKIHHSNFDAKHIPDQDYKSGFIRRDFTINAIMFEYNGREWRLVDPLNGVVDLKNRTLKACSNAKFVKDPVRFLRAIRFKQKLGFEFDISLLTLLKNMELKVSSHYLKTEAQKSNRPLSFLAECYMLRGSAFDLNGIDKFAIDIEEYENSFALESMKEHISFALFIPAKLRENILLSFGMSPKGQIDIALKEINLGKALSMSANELSKTSWATPLMSVFVRAEEIGEKRINWLFKYAGLEINYNFVEKYKTLNVEPSSSTPNNLKRFEVLQLKIAKLS